MATPDQAHPIFCARCSDELKPGSGELFQVTIVAVADPSPPQLATEASADDLRKDIEKLIARMEGISEREAMDQVHRRLVIHLCVPCYQQWIENPAGNK